MFNDNQIKYQFHNLLLFSIMVLSNSWIIISHIFIGIISIMSSESKLYKSSFWLPSNCIIICFSIKFLNDWIYLKFLLNSYLWLFSLLSLYFFNIFILSFLFTTKIFEFDNVDCCKGFTGLKILNDRFSEYYEGALKMFKV